MFRHSVRRLAVTAAKAAEPSAHTLAVSSAQGISKGLTGAIGNTPLIRLNKLSEETGCEILGKAEFMNPGGSIKDRAALYVVKDAEERGLLRPGGTVVEGTAGNTGIGLAHVCRSRGYKLVIYMPNTQSQGKIDLLRLLGAEVYPVPAVAFDNPENYNHQARRHAERLENAVWTNQFDNTANRRAHIETTGPEIWAQTQGKVNAFTCVAPDAGADQLSNQSDSEDDSDKLSKKRKTIDNTDAEDAGYNNSGDEAIIKKGEKRQKKAKAKAKGHHEDDDEGGEGGLVKTRRQRAAEKEERKYTTNNEPVTIDVDALWTQMMSGSTINKSNPKEGQKESDKSGTVSSDGKQIDSSATGEQSEMIRIKRTYNFAGRVHTEEKMVSRDSAEAKLWLASQGQEATEEEPVKRATRKAFRSAFEPLTDPLPQRADLNLGMAARMQASQEARAKKLNTVEKSRMDWAGFVDQEGIKNELELAGKSKDSYNAREDFLARSEARRDEESRKARVAARV